MVPTDHVRDGQRGRWIDRHVARLPLQWAIAVSDIIVLAVSAYLSRTSLAIAVIVTLVTMVTLFQRKNYRLSLTLSVLDQAPTLVFATLLGGVSAAAINEVAGTQSGREPLAMGAIAAFGVLVLRGALYDKVRRLRKDGYVNCRVLVVGAGHTGRLIGNLLREHPEHGLRPQAIWDTRPLLSEVELGLPLLPATMTLERAIQSSEAQAVIIAFSGHPEPQMVDLLRSCDRMSCETFLVPRLFELALRDGDMDEIWGLPLLRLRAPRYRTWRWATKRVMDVVVSSVLLALSSPLMLAIAIAIRVQGGPGVLFRQERVGMDGRPFQLLKFCSMRPMDADESATMWNIACDDRMTLIGRILRRTSLDELPQLWNVLLGQMSIVGPRPERPYYVDRFRKEFGHYSYRQRVPAGLTGWAQVHGLRGDTSIHERAKFDNYYIENWSLWLDIKILLRTFASVVRCEGR